MGGSLVAYMRVDDNSSAFLKLLGRHDHRYMVICKPTVK